MAETVMTYATGENYRFTLEKRVAVCRVIRRPDLAREVGASLAREKIEVFERLALEPKEKVSGVVLNLIDAPTTWGPVTHAALIAMLATIEKVDRRSAVVPADNFFAKDPSCKRIIRRSSPSLPNVCCNE